MPTDTLLRPRLRRRHPVVSAPLDRVTTAALRELLAPPAECEDEAERTVARVMALIHAAESR